ncbi:hypothetical protein [Flavobacterium sp.]|uniref:hypothetical protein n=1 Tax=Flavobacterium sp. TaxID=239 RepID=UPI00121B401A|nr:hypothetical protein [Flavobacterium sp.]RZJ71989.1 MAG: hypothetical protein EOO49_08135 [Flavobacterium sp.]
MKKLLLLGALALGMSAHSQVGIGTTAPSSSAMLDVTSTTSGMLVPRMTLVQRNTIGTPATGLLIYQTDNSPGFYYFDGATWVGISGGTRWTLTGNAATAPATNFIGTTDAQDFVTRTNNTERVRVTSAGRVGVGIAAPNASSAFDITSTTGGMLIPRMTLTQRNVIATPATGLFIYQTDNTPGFYYFDGTVWVGLANGIKWNLTGNAGTVAGTNFIGTTDAIDFSARTNNVERLRITSAGKIGVGTATPNASSLLDLTSTTAGVLVPRMNIAQRNAIGTPATGLLIYQTDSTPGFYYFDGTAWVGIIGGIKWNLTGNAGTVAGTNFIGTTDAIDLTTRTNNTERMRVTSAGNVGIGTAAPTSRLHVTSALQGQSSILGVNTNTVAGTISYGVRGESASTVLGSAGVYGASTNSGNNELGVVGDYSLWGAGVFGLGWNSTFANMPTLRDFGVFGTCTFTTGTGVYAYDGSNSVGSYAFYGTGKYAVTGTKSASVPTTKGNQLLYCTESPEIWFEDLGGAKLVNGSVHIDLDPMYIETIFVDNDKNKMRIFIQEEGESNGLIVIKDADNKGFTVKEKNGGTSNIDFSYRIMGKRRFYQNQRFGVDSQQPFGDNLANAKDAPLIPTDPQEMKRIVDQATATKMAQAKK